MVVQLVPLPLYEIFLSLIAFCQGLAFDLVCEHPCGKEVKAIASQNDLCVSALMVKN